MKFVYADVIISWMCHAADQAFPHGKILAKEKFRKNCLWVESLFSFILALVSALEKCLEKVILVIGWSKM